MTSVLRAWIVSLFAFREARTNQIVTALDKFEKCPPPIKRYDAKGQAVFIETPQPASTARGYSGKVVSYEWWMQTYAPDHKRKSA